MSDRIDSQVLDDAVRLRDALDELIKRRAAWASWVFQGVLPAADAEADIKAAVQRCGALAERFLSHEVAAVNIEYRGETATVRLTLASVGAPAHPEESWRDKPPLL